MRSKSALQKSNRILRIILVAFLIILFRVWHLEVIQRESKLKEAEQPKRRTIVLKADRGPIVDRFNIPLAVNKICYNATIYYNQILQIPASAWKQEESGKQVRHYPRREYIRNLSEMLGTLLELDPVRIEDLIHSKASLFPHVPYLLKSRLTEEEYHRLAFLEKDWLGIHAEIGSERFYPRGKAGGEVIGSMGPISSKEYLAIANEIRELQEEINNADPFAETALNRLQELKEKAYTIQDLVGKTGIEKKFEQQLRGNYGKNLFEVDPKGKCLQPLSGARQSIPGHEIRLSLSIELQEFAEALLAENEVQREGRSLRVDPETKKAKALKQPWIKGGAIVAMDPNTGEVLAMASTPRFDPNDFIPSSNPLLQSQKQKNISRWLENERLIAAIWDGRQDLIRERFSPKTGFFDETRPLTWDLFLETLLPQEGAFKSFFAHVDDVKSAVQIQEDFEALLYHCNLREPQQLLEKIYPSNAQFLESIRAKGADVLSTFKRLDALFSPFASNQDRLFALDLCRLVAYAPAFTDGSLKILEKMKLHQYRALNQMACRLEAVLKEKAQSAFRKREFAQWREKNQKTYLAQKRGEEKQNKRAAKPFLDYLDEKERELFALSWKEQRLDALREAALTQEKSSPLFQLCASLNAEQIKEIFHTFRSFDDLERLLLGSYPRLRNSGGQQTEKHLASAFYPIGGFGHSRSYAFQATAPPGSVFKLVTGYAGLMQTGSEGLFSLIDEVRPDPKGRSLTVANSLSGLAYPRMYKGGRLPRSSNPHIGKIDLMGAIERTSNPYFSILAGDVLTSPEDLVDAARLFGYGLPTGIDLFGEQAGHLPDDLGKNRTGLYSTAIGQHTLLSTPLQTAIMLSTIANGGKVMKPQILEAKRPQTIRTVDLPRSAREQLLEGMNRVLWSDKGTGRPGLIRTLNSNPALLSQYLALRNQMVGKTSTAEIMFNPSFTPSSTPFMYNHLWFGAISFDGPSQYNRPELVVIVFLRYGFFGKEAAPLAAQIVHKWREIKSKYQ